MTPSEPTLDQLNCLVTLLNDGRYQEVENQASALLDVFPVSGFAWLILGVSMQKNGKDSLFAMEKAVALLPGDAEAHCNLGVALEQLGRCKEAESSYRQSLVINPEYGNAHKNLGHLLRRMGRFNLAGISCQTALNINPHDPETHCWLGMIYRDLRKYAPAEAAFRESLRLDPAYAQAHCQLGDLFIELEQFPMAKQHYAQALALMPGNAQFHYNLGEAEQGLGLIESALDSYRLAISLNPNLLMAYNNIAVGLHHLGRCDEAIIEYQHALEIDPNCILVLSNLAIVFREIGRLEEAIDCYLAVLAIDPSNHQANLLLKSIYMRLNRLVDAEALCRKALAIKPDFFEMRQNLSVVLAYLSNFKDVIKESNSAFEGHSDHAMMWEQRLYSFSYHPDLTADAIFQEFLRWGDRFPEPKTNFTFHDRNPNRRLRIGYVSPDFRRHTSRFYFWPLFSNHNHDVVELFAYSNVKNEVEWTRLFKGQFEHWRDIRDLSDQAVADQIRADGIDILVDLCSHMQDDRLGVFALKPAPIQATWLGAAWTTGLKTVDYALLDQFIAPEGTLARESIIRLPHSFMIFQPPEKTADIVPTPCLENGYITFGYSGRTERLNHRTFRVWGEILQRLPDARLILDFAPFADPKTQTYYRDFLAQHGVDTTRVIFRKSVNIFEGLNDIDILLDSFPHGGGTMLMDSFWMGVPALTLASRPPLGRLGTGVWMNLGLPEWIAFTEDEFIEKAYHFVQHPEALNELRLGLRQRLKNSPLMDGPSFARAFEKAYRQMFATWLQKADSQHT